MSRTVLALMLVLFPSAGDEEPAAPSVPFAGRPDHFSGASGHFYLEAEVQPESVALDEPCVLSVITTFISSPRRNDARSALSAVDGTGWSIRARYISVRRPSSAVLVGFENRRPRSARNDAKPSVRVGNATTEEMTGFRVTGYVMDFRHAPAPIANTSQRTALRLGLFRHQYNVCAAGRSHRFWRRGCGNCACDQHHYQQGDLLSR